MNKGFFITGTDTDVGKTVVAGAVIRALHSQGIPACGMKPIETGCRREGDILYPADGMFLKNVAQMEEGINKITPYCFESPIAPYAASEMEGKEIDTRIISQAMHGLLKRYPAVVVEGVGGMLVPIKKDYFVVDLIKELDLPVVVVARPSLGTINHTLLTVNYALKEGVMVSGIVINFTKPQEYTQAENTNPRVISQLSPVPVIGIFPFMKNIDSETLDEYALKYLDIKQLEVDF